MGNTAGLGAHNAARVAAGKERFLNAIKAPTLTEAVTAYPRRADFWKAARRVGLTDQVKVKYATEIKEARRVAEAARTAGWIAVAATKRAALIEDAEWLARTGENIEHAARRLGYANLDTFETEFERYRQHGLLARLRANSANGHVRTGRIR